MDTNRAIAAQLREAADRLKGRCDSKFRCAAFRRAADTVEACPLALRELYERHGPAALESLPGVGPGIAGAMAEILITGRWKYLERLRERVIMCRDEQGVEHECIVVDPRSKSGVHGRDAIAALLRADRA
jgi:DNA polymerase/3'-5' exonuclease PolX